MSEEEIRKIALEYVEETTSYSEEDPNYAIEYGVACDAFKWLSERYCLVEKSKVAGEYTDAITEGKHAHVKHQIQSRTRIRQIERLFGKSLFEEEGE